MRHAASYGIVDRKLLFDQHLHRMSLEGMALYLFLILAADREGRSYYGDGAIAGILRLSPSGLAIARDELVSGGLIAYRAPNWWVKGLSSLAQPPPPPAHRPCASFRPSGEPAPVRGIVPEALRELIRSLEEHL